MSVRAACGFLGATLGLGSGLIATTPLVIATGTTDVALGALFGVLLAWAFTGIGALVGVGIYTCWAKR